MRVYLLFLTFFILSVYRKALLLPTRVANDKQQLAEKLTFEQYQQLISYIPVNDRCQVGDTQHYKLYINNQTFLRLVKTSLSLSDSPIDKDFEHLIAAINIASYFLSPKLDDKEMDLIKDYFMDQKCHLRDPKNLTDQLKEISGYIIKNHTFSYQLEINLFKCKIVDWATSYRMPNIYKNSLLNPTNLIKIIDFHMNGDPYAETEDFIEYLDGEYKLKTPILQQKITKDQIRCSIARAKRISAQLSSCSLTFLNAKEYDCASNITGTHSISDKVDVLASELDVTVDEAKIIIQFYQKQIEDLKGGKPEYDIIVRDQENSSSASSSMSEYKSWSKIGRDIVRISQISYFPRSDMADCLSACIAVKFLWEQAGFKEKISPSDVKKITIAKEPESATKSTKQIYVIRRSLDDKK